MPLAALCWALPELWSDPYDEPIKKLGPLLLPFILWFVLIFIECAAIDWRLARKWEAARERRFFGVFGTSLAVIGALFLVTYVLGAQDWKPLGPYLELVCRVSSVAATTIVARFIEP